MNKKLLNEIIKILKYYSNENNYIRIEIYTNNGYGYASFIDYDRGIKARQLLKKLKFKKGE